MMGSPDTQADRNEDEGPPRKVTIAKPFLVSKYEVTFDEWDACSETGGCSFQPDDEGWGRGKRPVINVSWIDIQQYLKWLSNKTGLPYRPVCPTSSTDIVAHHFASAFRNFLVYRIQAMKLDAFLIENCL